MCLVLLGMTRRAGAHQRDEAAKPLGAAGAVQRGGLRESLDQLSRRTSAGALPIFFLTLMPPPVSARFVPLVLIVIAGMFAFTYQRPTQAGESPRRAARRASGSAR